MQEKNIFPVFGELISRQEKEKRLKQHSSVFWFTGLSGSGKTTIAKNLEKRLFEEGFFTQILDGDNIRTGLNKNLGFSEKDRTENIRRIAEISKLFLNAGIITIACFVSPLRSMRKMAKEIIGEKDFFEIYIKAPLSLCEKRDVKGLYKKARKGEINNFTGITSTYEEPEKADLIVDTSKLDINSSVEKVYNFVLPIIKVV